MDIAGMLKSTVADKIGEKFGLSSDKVEGVIDTIVSVVGNGGDTSSMLSGLTDMLGGGSSDDGDMGSNIVSALTSKNGLSGETAGGIKDMVLPLIMDGLKDNAGDLLGGF